MGVMQPFSLPSFTVKDMWKVLQMSLAPTGPSPLYVVCRPLSLSVYWQILSLHGPQQMLISYVDMTPAEVAHLPS